jgi:peptidoglycan/LPS O-acetylase OafA/YrhL
MKLNQLTFTRFLAAISIVIFHSGTHSWPFSLPFLHEIFSKSNIGVSYFFILSGFVMIIAYWEKNKSINFIQYYLNRFARIYPLYIFALVITTAILSHNKGLDVNAFILSVTLLQAWVPKYALSLNIPGWTLSVELLFYISFPLLFNYFYRKYNLLTVGFYIIGFWMFSQFLINYLLQTSFSSGDRNTAIHFFPIVRLNEFLVGNFIGLIFINAKVKQRNYDALLIALSTVFLMYFFLNIKLDFSTGLIAVIFAPFILLLASNTGMITKLFKYQVFVILGEVSYGVYILQFPVHLLVSFFFRTSNSLNVKYEFYVFVTTLLVVSVICYYFIEIPARNLIKRWSTNEKGWLKRLKPQR